MGDCLMATLKINGDTSGYVELVSPAVAGSTSIELDKILVADSSGNVGIGVSDPDSKLEIVSHANQEPLTIQATTNSYNYITHRNSAGTDVAYTGLGGGAAVTTGAVTDYAIRATTNLLFGAGSNSERMRIDSSGNLLVGTTDSDPNNNSANTSADDGFAVTSNVLRVAKYNDNAAVFNRTGNNGSIVQFRKSGTTVGNIGTVNSGFLVGSTDSALYFHTDNNIYPYNPSSSAYRNGDVDLGWSGARFKDLHLSGNISVGGTVDGRDVATDGTKLDTIGTGAGAKQDVFYENSQTVSSSYTITTNKSAMSAGPVTLDTSVTVTIPSGSRWVIV